MLPTVLRAIMFYIIILLTLRVLGKREIGELNLVDLIVTLMISDIAVVCIEDLEKPAYIYIGAIFGIAGFQILFSYISLKSNWFRKLTEGSESIIMYEGKLNIKEMRKQKYTVDDLLSQCREKGIYSLSKVKYAILETSGDISIFTTEQPSPFPLIISGKIVEKNLAFNNVTKEWLRGKLEEKEMELKKVFYADIINNELNILDEIQV